MEVLKASKKYVAYYRVSTSKQEASGLGLEAQQEAVKRLSGCPDGSCISKEFTETESGKKNNRPVLAQALEYSKSTGYTLIIAKLDRLSRDVEFIFSIKNSGANVIAADLPDFNTLNVGVRATFAQHEREVISQRTKDALSQIKARIARDGQAVSKRGNVITGLGNPSNLTDAARAKATEALRKKARESKNNIQVLDKIKGYLKDGLSFQKIADQLNALHYKTSRGKEFKAGTINMLVQRLRSEQA